MRLPYPTFILLHFAPVRMSNAQNAWEPFLFKSICTNDGHSNCAIRKLIYIDFDGIVYNV